ncbi:hypothetical protein [Kangiella sp. TOML190]|uniref:hypothetical protein n=1 Tax=Kangiella sp. TOML190 TaxID=2931351 RepID=UPI00203EB584|nr:hypothetical protein [Kangiella sp. TOML190]
MEILHEILRYTHMIGGFVGLGLFWIPIFSKKGGKIHRQMGKYWTWLGRLVVLSALAGLFLYIPEIIEKNMSPNSYAPLLFLAYLSVVTYIIISYGVAVLASKKDPLIMNTLYWNSMAYISLVASICIIAFAFIIKPDSMVVLLALSPVGLLTGFGILKYIKGKHSSNKAWLYEHLGSMLGAGIAFHTAFAVFGVTRIFDIGLEGFIAVIPWILPAVIGIPAQIIWTRHYQRKFKEI